MNRLELDVMRAFAGAVVAGRPPSMLEFVNAHVLPAAFALLPAKLDTPNARAHVLAIGLQESEFRHRRQLPRKAGGRSGPARGLWQFELGGGITGVLTHPSTRTLIAAVLEELRYVPAASACYEAVEHNDVLAAVFARLNLLWLPRPIPGRAGVGQGWRDYLEAWRPGDPHPEKWAANWALAWEVVQS